MQRFLHLASLALIAIAVLIAPRQAQAIDDAAICGVQTARQEPQQGIPDRLLLAISLVESGRWDSDRQASFAWPWTVTAEGEGRYLPSKAAAVAEVKRLQASGIRNIDVGCMQVNLQAHPDAFATLDDAFDPAQNVAYAARFLRGLYDSTGNWPTAGAYYHSQTPNLAASYKAKLISTWEQVRKGNDDRLQLASAEPAGQFRQPVGLWLPASPPVAAVRRLTPPTTARSTQQQMRVAEARAKAQARSRAERVEAKHIADAYRQAQLAAYRLRRAQMAGG